MKILFTTLNSKHSHSSLALRYLEKYCRDSFPDIDIQEYTINQCSDYILGEIYKEDYDLICFSCYIWNITEILELVTNLKKVNPQLTIMLGGPEVSFNPEELMEKHPEVDYIARGEGELTLLELLTYLETKTGHREDIKSLSYRDGQVIKTTPERPLITDLGLVPFPYEEDLNQLDNKIIYYESSRGCPYKCAYCLSSTSRGVRFFPLARVKKDLAFFLKSKVEQVKFVDRTFNANRKHSLEIMRFIHEHDNGFTNFHFEITGDLLDEETLSFLSTVREGLFQFEIGVQSTNPSTIKAINRAVDWDKLKIAIKRLASFNNIHLHLDLIAGLPYEDFTSFKKSFNDVYALQPEKLQLGFLKLLKGTALMENKEVYDYKYRDLPPYEVLTNKYLDFDKTLKLKGIEEMLETYYNSANFTYSIKYLVSNFYPEAAEFYQELDEYWQEKGYQHFSHSKSKLYSILLDFYKKNNYPYQEIFTEILKLDFLNNNKNKIPSFLPQIEQKHIRDARYDFLKEEKNIAKYLPKYSGQRTKKILNRIHFELFRYDLFEIIDKPTILTLPEKPTVILFDYNQINIVTNNARFFKVDMGIL